MGREGRRFEFGWLEVLGLILVFALGSALVFMLGILVGKGLQENQLVRDDWAVKLPIGEAADGVASSAGDSTRQGATPAEPVAEGPAAGAVGAAGSSAVNLAVRPPTPSSRPTATADLAAAPVPTPSGAVRGPTPTPAAKATARPTSKPTPKPTPKPTSKPKPTPKPTRVPAVATATPVARAGGWSVQVNATRDESTANGLVRRLQEKGYNAYVVRVGRDGETWYRVRVGRFPTMEAASTAVGRLKSDGQFSGSFLVNE